MSDTAFVRLENVTREFRVGHRRVKALAGVDLEIRPGQTMAIVGESGSGKTTLGNLILGIDRPTSGRVLVGDVEVAAPRPRPLRRRIQVVQQNPYSTLNPKRTVRRTLELPITVHGLRPRSQRQQRIEELLDIVGLAPEYMNRYPGTLSGGQRQRVALARALAAEPDLIVLDEPTSALDVSVQARILRLLVDLQGRFRLSYVFITHDLSVVRNIADDVGVLYRGLLVEVGRTAEVFRTPMHRYTTMLLSSIPVVTSEDEALKPRWDWTRSEIGLETAGLDACPFMPRCPFAIEPCRQTLPQLTAESAHHRHACFNRSTDVIGDVSSNR